MLAQCSAAEGSPPLSASNLLQQIHLSCAGLSPQSPRDLPRVAVAPLFISRVAILTDASLHRV